MEDFTKIRTWAEVDLNALAHNYRALRALTPEGCKFLGLVKANAYGHGAVPVAKKLEELGCDMLAVACVAEAAQLRQAGITLPILCLGYTPVEETEALLRYHVTQTVGDLDTGRALSEAAQRAGGVLDIHVKLDTGMGRIGFLWQLDGDNGPVADDIAALCALPGLAGGGHVHPLLRRRRQRGLYRGPAPPISGRPDHPGPAGRDLPPVPLRGQRRHIALCLHPHGYDPPGHRPVWLLPRPGHAPAPRAGAAPGDDGEEPGGRGAGPARRVLRQLWPHRHPGPGLPPGGGAHRLWRRLPPAAVQPAWTSSSMASPAPSWAASAWTCA